MKRFLLLVSLALFAFALPIAQVGCSTPPSARVVQVQSLKAVGHSAEAIVATSAQLYQAKTITAEQARQVMDFYDNKWLPAYQAAAVAVSSNLDSLASPDLTNLLNQLSALLNSYTSQK